MWGKNSHCILPSKPTSFKIWTPFCVNTGLRTVSSVSCGSWHAVALTGIPGKSCSRLQLILCQPQSSPRNVTYNGIKYVVYRN